MSVSAITDSWRELNERLRTATESECEKLLQKELSGANRLRHLMRIRGRHRVLRDARELNDLQQQWSKRHGA